MKRCPECRRDYYDDTLLYCLDDGSALLEGPASRENATAVLPSEDRTRLLTDRPAPRATIHRAIWAVLAVSALTASGLLWYWYSGGGVASLDSIAVLPFENASGDPTTDYLSDGLTESLINSFAELRRLRVIARTTAFRYKGKPIDAQAVGRELGVEAVLTGRVRQIGRNVELQADLIETSSGAQLWGARYERSATDALFLKQELVREVTQRLRLDLSRTEQNVLTRHDSKKSEAYQLFLQGKASRRKSTPDGVRLALEKFQRSVEIDPEYALAFAEIGDCYIWLAGSDIIPHADGMTKAREAVLRALALDDSLGEAHSVLSHIYDKEWRWLDSLREARRAIELSPGNPRMHALYANYLMYHGLYDEALANANRAFAVDPQSPEACSMISLAYLLMNDAPNGEEWARRAMELSPESRSVGNYLGSVRIKQRRYEEACKLAEGRVAVTLRVGSALRDLGNCYALAGKRPEAQKILDELKEKVARGEATGQNVAGVYAGLGDHDAAFAWLEKDFQSRSGALQNVTYLVAFDPLRGDARYQILLDKMGLSAVRAELNGGDLPK